LRISRIEAEYIVEYEFGRDQEIDDGMWRVVTINGYVIGEVESFKYLRSFVQRGGGFVVDVKHRIKWG